MIEHQGVIREISGDTALVSVSTDGCSSCSHQGGCAMGRMSARQSEATLKLSIPAGLAVGNTVTLSLPEGQATLGLLAGYLLPTVTLVLGAGVGASYGDAASALGALLGLLSGLLVTRLFPGLIPKPSLQLATPKLSPDPLPNYPLEPHHEH